MSNLTPQIRTNKNGIPVKKYVRLDPKASLSLSSVPAPLAAPASKRSPAQIKSEPRSLSCIKYEADKRLFRPKGAYEFTASDVEMLDVMSITDNANAFALLNMGIRTADEAYDHLQELGADDLIKDRSALTKALLERELSPVDAADMVELAQIQTRTPAETTESSPYFADAVEVHSLMADKDPHFDARRMIIEGSLSLADLKEFGYERLMRCDTLGTMTESLQKQARGEANYSISDLKKVFDKLVEEGHSFGHQDVRAKQSIKLLDRVGWEGVDKLYGMDEFTLRYNQPASELDELTAIDTAYYEAILATGMEKVAGQLGGRSMKYWATEFPGEAKILRQAGISTEEAIPLMAEGKTAYQTIGALKDINSNLAEGWL